MEINRYNCREMHLQQKIRLMIMRQYTVRKREKIRIKKIYTIITSLRTTILKNPDLPFVTVDFLPSPFSYIYVYM